MLLDPKPLSRNIATNLMQKARAEWPIASTNDRTPTLIRMASFSIRLPQFIPRPSLAPPILARPNLLRSVL